MNTVKTKSFIVFSLIAVPVWAQLTVPEKLGEVRGLLQERGNWDELVASEQPSIKNLVELLNASGESTSQLNVLGGQTLRNEPEAIRFSIIKTIRFRVFETSTGNARVALANETGEKGKYVFIPIAKVIDEKAQELTMLHRKHIRWLGVDEVHTAFKNVSDNNYVVLFEDEKEEYNKISLEEYIGVEGGVVKSSVQPVDEEGSDSIEFECKMESPLFKAVIQWDSGKFAVKSLAQEAPEEP